MGVSGVGKSTVGQRLAHVSGFRFVDADQFHNESNINKMQAGLALDDNDRGPWLLSLKVNIEHWIKRGENIVLACSALKQAYRNQFGNDISIRVVYLKADYELIFRRLLGRRDHFMSSCLLSSQFADLEEPHDALVIDAGQAVDEVVWQIKASLAI